MFVSHGVPILHGIEVYKRRPIFYGLGNFIFHIAVELKGAVPDLYTSAPVFQSVVADCQFDGSALTSLWLDPITLKSDTGVGEGGYKLHGNPHVPSPPRRVRFSNVWPGCPRTSVPTSRSSAHEPESVWTP
jgi:poly-gamma-glutamate synthesis protein (capsule biosynthesis protein)